MGDNSMSPADFKAITDSNNNGFGGDSWWIILLFLFAIAGGWGNNGGFGGGQGSTSVYEGYVLNNDMSMLQRAISDSTNMLERRTDNIINGICTLGYDSLAQSNAINTNVMQGFNAVQTQLADCCCKTQQNIKDTQYAIATTGANIQGAIKDCCCDTEKSFMQNRFDMAQYNCNTLQAIDKVGDRIIDYLANDKAQALRDENQALRLSASQSMQNQYLINALRPTPVPAFPASNLYGYWNNNGCGCTQNI